MGYISEVLLGNVLGTSGTSLEHNGNALRTRVKTKDPFFCLSSIGTFLCHNVANIQPPQKMLVFAIILLPNSLFNLVFLI
jgi:hypothetical protein